MTNWKRERKLGTYSKTKTKKPDYTNDAMLKSYKDKAMTLFRQANLSLNDLDYADFLEEVKEEAVARTLAMVDIEVSK